jgi:uncharacterized RDD family membrane protein YckC
MRRKIAPTVVARYGASRPSRAPEGTMTQPPDPNQEPSEQPPYGQFSPPPAQPSSGGLSFEKPQAFNPPPSAQPYAQPAGQAPYGQSPPYGQAPYAPPAYGPPQYGQAQYGQPAYGQPQYGQPAYGYPAAPPPTDASGRRFDPASSLYLPNGVELATVGRRIGAYFLAIPLAIITLGIGYLIWGLVLWGQGTTPALRVLNMKVYRVDRNEVPGFGGMALREIVGRIVDGIFGPITQLISFILFVTGDRRQSLHDHVASTTVVYDPNRVLG